MVVVVTSLRDDMADLMTHFALSYGLTRSEYFQRFRCIFYVGAILPDVLSRPFYILKPALYSYTVAIHTPFFMTVFCLWCAEFFNDAIRPWVRKYLLLGVALHFVIDLFQKHVTGGYIWFFPFSWRSFEIGLYWPHEPLRFIPVWIFLILSTEIVMWVKSHHRLEHGAHGR
jgi:hypothetical protein